MHLKQKREKTVKSSKETLQEIQKLKSELYPSVHFDFTEQIESVMKNHDEHCELIGRRIPMRQYMWDLFAVTMIMHITDSVVKRKDMDYPTDKYTRMSVDELVEKARDCLDGILTGKHEASLISEEQEDISTYPYTDAEKLLAILKSAYIGSIAFMKIRNYEELFVVPEQD